MRDAFEMKAFPIKNRNMFDDNEGMDMRDYFAAKAMQSMLPLIMQAVGEQDDEEKGKDVMKQLPSMAYKLADLMMMERNK